MKKKDRRAAAAPMPARREGPAAILHPPTTGDAQKPDGHALFRSVMRRHDRVTTRHLAPRQHHRR